MDEVVLKCPEGLYRAKLQQKLSHGQYAKELGVMRLEGLSEGLDNLGGHLRKELSIVECVVSRWRLP